MDTNNLSLMDLRHQAGLSQEEMAHRLGISRSYYNALECERRKPGKWLLQTLRVIQDELMRTLSTNALNVHSASYTQTPSHSMTVDESLHPAGKDEILDYLHPWLERIGHDPNVAPFILTQLRKHLPYDDLDLFRS